MVENEGKKEEEKFEFTPEDEALGYISLGQARVVAKPHSQALGYLYTVAQAASDPFGCSGLGDDFCKCKFHPLYSRRKWIVRSS